jgi:hypothetical protein
MLAEGLLNTSLRKAICRPLKANELGIKAMHREVEYALREYSKAYGGEFATENEALRRKMQSYGRNLFKLLRQKLVRPRAMIGASKPVVFGDRNSFAHKLQA